jgi:hypothetical protein
MSLKNMVGPCGLEPQTSTVSITRLLGTAKYLIIPSDWTHLGLAIGLKNDTASGSLFVLGNGTCRRLHGIFVKDKTPTTALIYNCSVYQGGANAGIEMGQ